MVIVLHYGNPVIADGVIVRPVRTLEQTLKTAGRPASTMQAGWWQLGCSPKMQQPHAAFKTPLLGMVWQLRRWTTCHFTKCVVS